MPMGPGMMGKRLSLAFAVVGQSAVRVATAGRECIAVVAMPKTHAGAMTH